jgi:uncharacterized protein (TIGR00255 family)
MIRSMTGYGNAKGLCGDLALTVEIKSVNNRFLDASVRIPRLYSFAEESVRSAVAAKVGRGKVDVWVGVENAGTADVTVTLNEPLVEAYRAAFNQMFEKWGIPDDSSASLFARLPDVFVVEKQELDEEAFSAGLAAVVSEALDAFNAMREREGGKLADDLRTKLDNLESMRLAVAARSPESVAQWRDKLTKRITDLLEGKEIDEQRILTEAALFAEKVDVDEELVRLGSHITQFRGMLDAGGAVGRKLDFLVQEMNREANTTGSKCTDLEITRIVVDMKAEIEKLREQIQNIE